MGKRYRSVISVIRNGVAEVDTTEFDSRPEAFRHCRGKVASADPTYGAWGAVIDNRTDDYKLEISGDSKHGVTVH